MVRDHYKTALALGVRVMSKDEIRDEIKRLTKQYLDSGGVIE